MFLNGSSPLQHKRLVLYFVLFALIVLMSLLLTSSSLLNQCAIHWNRVCSTQTPAIQTCQPVTNIAFIKTHKTGSSTISNILMRFGLRHNLNFALPNTDRGSRSPNHISVPGEVLGRNSVCCLAEQQEYNILMHHAVYNKKAFRQIMPSDTKYISIVRDPFSHLISSIQYYKFNKYFMSKTPNKFNASNSVSSYLENFNIFRKNDTNFTILRNRQALDLGFRQEHYQATKFKECIETLNKDLALVMILEYFDEGLLLLKRELCWEMKDIIYLPVNRNTKKKTWNFTETEREIFKNISLLDYAVYSYFLSKFQEKLKSLKEDFFEELAYFKSLLQNVKVSCLSGNTLVAKDSKWHKAFKMDKDQCTFLGKSLLNFKDLLYSRLKNSDNENVKKINRQEGSYIDYF